VKLGNSNTFTINVNCNDAIISQASGLVKTYKFYKNVGNTASIVLDDSLFSTDIPDCPVERYVFTETTVSNLGLSNSCPSPGASAGCRTVVVPLSNIRTPTSTNPIYKYKFEIYVRGLYQKIEISDFEVEVECSNLLLVVESAILTINYNFPMALVS